MQKEFELTSLFQQFINDSVKGRRLKPNGQRIKQQTVANYENTLKLIREFEATRSFIVRVRILGRLNTRQQKTELSYWKRFYRHFSFFLQKNKGCFDNYIGSIFKNLRAFLNYLRKERMMNIGDIHKCFFIHKEEIPVVTLMPGQLQFLISNQEFSNSIGAVLRRTKDLFVFGCTVALRYSDLIKIKLRDFELINGSMYLSVKSLKTEQITRVKLPQYAIEIVAKNRKKKKNNQLLFSTISMNQLNRNIRKLAELAGWIQEIGKKRKLSGKDVEIHCCRTRKNYRFCDLLSSHTMRRTAVTTMLLLGMPEHTVRKISGHAANSTAFYKYVNFVQSYLDAEIDKVHDKLMVA